MKNNFQTKCLSAYIGLAYFATPLLMAFFVRLAPFQLTTERNILFSFAAILSAGFSAYIYRKKLFQDKNCFLLFPIILFIGICLRISLFPEIKSGDYDAFLHPWIEKMRQAGWPLQLTLPITNYNIPYLYFLIGISYIPFPDLYLIKGVSVLFDCILAITILFILKKSLRLTDFKALFGFGLSLIIPSLFLNSSAWGQCDSFYVSLLLMGLYLCLSHSPNKGCFLLGLAFSAKMQAVFVFPVLLFFIFYKQLHVRHLLWIPIAYFISILPAAVFGRSLISIISIYSDQVSYYPSLTSGAPSFWAIFPNTLYAKLLAAALCLSAFIGFIFTFGTLLTRPIKNKVDFWDIAFIYALIIPYFLPKMHERYFYMALAFSIIYSFKYYKRSILALGIVLIDLFSYLPFLFGFSVIDLKWLSLVFLFIIGTIIFLFFKGNCKVVLDTNSSLQQNVKTTNHKAKKIKILAITCGLLICVFGTAKILNFTTDKKSDKIAHHRISGYDGKIKTKHPFWEEELLKYDDRVIRESVMDIAEILQLDENEMVLRWNTKSTEYFVKDSSGAYSFKKGTKQ